MKPFLFFSLSLFSLTAWATPQVGDFAAYDLQITMGENSLEAQVQNELLQENQKDGTFLERETTTLQGETETSEEWKSASDYLDDVAIDNALANCAEIGGTLQSIEVPAGRFDTCRIAFDNADAEGVIYIAKVPFGFAQVDNMRKEDGLVISTKLREYR